MKKPNYNAGKSRIKKVNDFEFIVSEPIGLLEFLLANLKGYSRNNVKSVLKHKEVLVDGKVVTQFDHLLKPGQKIRVIRKKSSEAKLMESLEIIFENDEIIAINKPAGLLSIASDTEKALTAYHLLTDHVKETNPRGRIFAVHRLDRETSGVLIVAKNEEIKVALQDNWAELVTVRGYVAVVEGAPKEKSGIIRSWLRQTKTLVMYSSSTEGDGLEAITEYSVLKENPDYALLDIRLQTGRKNQIRVHMKDLGCSVVGDKKYGSTTNPLKRLGLHANILELKHPISGEIMRFEAKPPQSFLSLFGRIK